MSYLSTKGALLLSEDDGPHKAESHGEDRSPGHYLPLGRRDTHEGGWSGRWAEAVRGGGTSRSQDLTDAYGPDPGGP